MDFLQRIGHQLSGTAVIMITASDDASVAAHAMKLGAADYLVKPFAREDLLSSIKEALRTRELSLETALHQKELEDQVRERTRQIQEVQDATVFVMAKIAQSRDDETGLHLERMREYCQLLTRKMRETHVPGVNEQFIVDIYRASPLHDVGKVGIADAILLKPERHSPEEFELMKTHTVIGASCLEGAANLVKSEVGSFLRLGHDIARWHHESWDGKGYPDNLQGEAIPLAARIVSVGDFYDALAFPRVYRRSTFGHEQILSMVSSLRGSKFDPQVVDVFLSVEKEFLAIRQQWTDSEKNDESRHA
jgi:putative two-component system response regulator